MKRVPSQLATLLHGVVAALRRSTAGWRGAAARLRQDLAGTSRPGITSTLLLALFVSIVILSSATWFLLGQYQSLGGTYFLIDDAWIHLRFAKNLAKGYGFSFNPGHPIASSTAPLWTILLALSYRLSGDLLFSAYFWGVVFFVITCLLTYQLVFLVTDSFFLAAVSAIVCSLCPWLTWSALSGMEIMFSAALVMTTLFLHVKYQNSSTWKGFLGVVAAAFTTLTRPETYVLFLAIVIHKVALSLLRPRENLRRTLLLWLPMAGLIFALIVLPYGLFSIVTAGSFLPNTFSAKVGDLGLIGAIKVGSAKAIKQALLTYPRLYLADFAGALWGISPVLVVVLPLGILGLLAKDFCVLSLFLVLFPLVVGMVVPTDRISWPWSRHMLNLIPAFVVVSLAGSKHILEKALSRAGKKAVRPRLLAILMIAMSLSFLVEQPAVSKSFVSRGAVMKEEHVAVANWINEHLPPQAAIAASDIGVMGFYTQRFIIDTEGIITPEILGQYRRNGPAKDQEVYQYLERTKPDYLVKFYWVYPTFSKAEFTPIHTSGTLVVYRTPWTRY